MHGARGPVGPRAGEGPRAAGRAGVGGWEEPWVKTSKEEQEGELQRWAGGAKPALPRCCPGRAPGEAPYPGTPSRGEAPGPAMSSPPPARKGFYRQEVTKTAWEVRAVYQDLQPVGSGAYGAVW